MKAAKYLSKFNKHPIIENFVFALIIKIFYDVMVLQCLPKIYVGNITYGVMFSPDKLFVGYLTFAISTIISLHFIRKKKNNISLGLLILLDLYYAPTSSAYYINNASFLFLLCVSVFFILLTVVNCCFFNTSKFFKERQVGETMLNKKAFVFLAIAVCLMCVVYAYSYNGLSISLDINSVYDVRAAFVGSTNTITSILFHFGGQVVTVGALYGLMKKKPIIIGLCFFAQLCIFSIARQKSDLLILLIVIAIWIISLLKLFDFVKDHISFFLCLATVVSFLEFAILKSTTLFGLFVRRMMYFPSLLNYYYYDYFSHHTLLLFSQDVFLINRLKIGIYDVPVITLINEAYFGGYVPSPNTGLFAEAFMHFGYLGVFLFPFIFIGLSKLFTSAISIFSKEVQFLVVVQFFLTLMNIPMTGGVFVVTYFLWIPFAWLVTRRKQPNLKIKRVRCLDTCDQR